MTYESIDCSKIGWLFFFFNTPSIDWMMRSFVKIVYSVNNNIFIAFNTKKHKHVIQPTCELTIQKIVTKKIAVTI
eukprot:m.4283 g.4283  ORF g.4283 m.4283 type:complete len:75 (-) comp2202_c0_seq1:71-295(-)